MPQGFHTAPAICHRHAASKLDRLRPQDRAYVCSSVDDRFIFGQAEEQVKRLTENALALIQVTGFQVNLEKVQVVQTTVNYLGVVIRSAGRRAITEMPAPARSLRRL